MGFLGLSGLGLALSAASMTSLTRDYMEPDRLMVDPLLRDPGPVEIMMPGSLGYTDSLSSRIREATRTARQPQVTRTRCMTMGDGEPTAPGLMYTPRPPPSLEAAASAVERAGDKRARREARRKALAARSSTDG